MMHFKVGHTKGHHNIGRGMGFREHVLDLPTGLDVPFRDIVFLHGLDVAIALFF